MHRCQQDRHSPQPQDRIESAMNKSRGSKKGQLNPLVYSTSIPPEPKPIQRTALRLKYGIRKITHNTQKLSLISPDPDPGPYCDYIGYLSPFRGAYNAVDNKVLWTPAGGTPHNIPRKPKIQLGYRYARHIGARPNVSTKR